MSDAEVLAKYTEMLAEFGEKLPDPDHEPIRFAYYCKLFTYMKKIHMKETQNDHN